MNSDKQQNKNLEYRKITPLEFIQQQWLDIAIVICLFLLLLLSIVIIWWFLTASFLEEALLEETQKDISGVFFVPLQKNMAAVSDRKVIVPEWITWDILPMNEYSRPGTKLDAVNGVVVHYIGNPGTTAEQNRSYYEQLAQTHETKVSSHFLIGIDGKIIQCVPLDEVAYCSNNRNGDTISIECCHADKSGQFSKATMDSLIKLLGWLADTYGLRQEQIIRHYDVTGKQCPRYYVNYPEEWEHLLDSVEFPP